VSVELRAMRWAIVASRHRSLRRAAEALSVRQSTLSRGLRDLELQLGAVLFERSNGGTRPTIEGQEFLETALRIVEETDGLAARLRTRSRGESGRIVVGVHSSLSAGNLRATLIEYHRRFPDVRTSLVDGSSAHLISDLTNSAIDIAFIADGDVRWNGKSLCIWSERVVVAVPTDHPLSGREEVHWHDLETESILLPQRGPGPEFHKLLVERVGRPASCDLRRHDVSLDRLLTLVGCGHGVLLALEGATGASYPGVTFREIHDGGTAARVGFRAIWRENSRNASLRRFLDMLRERYPDLSAEPDPS
jgi:DNA-binding transcriptional LysR family regulator